MRPADPVQPSLGSLRPAGTARPPAGRGISLYTLLTTLPLLVLLPFLAYSGYLLYLFGRQADDAGRRDLLAASQALAAVIDREFEQARQALLLVAGAADPAPGRARAVDMDRLLEGVVRAGVGLDAVTVLDPGGSVVTRYPAVRGPGRIELQRPQLWALASGGMVVSDLHLSPFDGQLAVSLNQSARSGTRGELLLSARVDVAHLAHVLDTQTRSREAVAILLDTQLRVVARTREMDRFFGELPGDDPVRAVRSAPAGVGRFATRDGLDYLWAWSTTREGWHVLLGIPPDAADLSLRDSMARLLGVGTALLVLGLAATILVVRRIARSVDRMTASAEAIGHGRGGSVAPSGIRQLDDLYDALRTAGQDVAESLQARERAVAAEREARALADESNRQKDHFIATLSHELRNPLAPVRASAAILRAPDLPDDRRLWAAAMIERQVSALARLLDDLLDLSRITTGRFELKRRDVLLGDVIDSAVETARPLLEERRHQLEVRLPQGELHLDADPVRLVQVLSNLLTNAAKYTDPGGRIEVCARRLDGVVQVEVRDNGIGLDPADADRVFDRFVQIRGSHDRAQGGLGIGLSLVRSLVEMHGGRVWAHSAGPGQGSTFAFELPLAAATAPSPSPG